MTLTPDNCFAWISIGDNSSTTQNPRAVDLPRWNEGVFSFHDLVDQWALPLYSNGCRTFILWEPWGLTYPSAALNQPTPNDFLTPWTFTLNGASRSYKTPQNVDSYLVLKEANYAPYREMVDTFVPAINRLKQQPGVRVICYAGTALGNPNFLGMSQSRIFSRLNQALDPYYETGCDLVFDSACMLPPDHWMVQFFPTLQAAGLNVSVESVSWAYPYQQALGCITSLEQLNAASAASAVGLHAPDSTGFVGFGDLTKNTSGRRVGALLSQFPANFTAKQLGQLLPRVFNTSRVDAVSLDKSWLLGPSALTFDQINALCVPTTAADFQNFLTMMPPNKAMP